MIPVRHDRNPFHHQGPIQDRNLFFDRDADVIRILAKLRRGQSVSVFGTEKIGKTSLLLHISDPQVAAQYGLVVQKHLICYIDCKKWAHLDESGCFGWIKEAVEKAILVSERCPISAPTGTIGSDAYYWLDRLLFLFERAGLQLTLQLDHFDWLAHHDRLTHSLLGNLRALSEMHDCTSYLTASRRSLVDLQRALPRIMESPFFDIFWDHELRPFSWDETYEFLTKRLESEGVSVIGSILEFLACLGRGEPYLLQLACACAYDVWESKGGNCLSDEDCGEIEKRFKRDLQSPSGAAI